MSYGWNNSSLHFDVCSGLGIVGAGVLIFINYLKIKIVVIKQN